MVFCRLPAPEDLLTREDLLTEHIPRTPASRAGPRVLSAVAFGAVAQFRLDDQARAAIAASSLGSLPQEVIAELTAGAKMLRIPARSTFHHAGEDSPHLELVLAGLVRVQVASADGRTMTVRYARPGALLGVATLYAPVARPFGIQALSNSELLGFRPEIVRGWADRDSRVAKALLTETSERVMSFVAEFSGHAFANVRQRIARHLLDLASDHQRPDELLAPISQQELADAVGTVREVVVRVLRELREVGVVHTGRDGITIRDPERLAGIGSASWNGSS
jgi:CRP/FNR family cyclic AMP-dependent transcriptional regulator